jgi:hypothetical protein
LPGAVAGASGHGVVLASDSDRRAALGAVEAEADGPAADGAFHPGVGAALGAGDAGWGYRRVHGELPDSGGGGAFDGVGDPEGRRYRLGA